MKDKKEVDYYSDFDVNGVRFDDYEEARAYKNKLLDDGSLHINFTGYDERLKKRVCFYLYSAPFTPFDPRDENTEKELCKKYYEENYKGTK